MLSKKADAAIRSYVKNSDKRDIAYAKVIGSAPEAHPGPCRILPVIGWIRVEHGHPFLTLSCIMLKVLDDRHLGTLSWNIPLNPRTERTAATLLASLGWDGRVWPQDRGWPDGLAEETGLHTLLNDAQIGATMTFPPKAQGSLVLRVEVAKMSNDFPLNPEVPAEDRREPTDELVDRLHQLTAEPETFE